MDEFHKKKEKLPPMPKGCRKCPYNYGRFKGCVIDCVDSKIPGNCGKTSTFVKIFDDNGFPLPQFA
jgi:hypothetical protein